MSLRPPRRDAQVRCSKMGLRHACILMLRVFLRPAASDARIVLVGGLTPPRPLDCPTPSLPHSCGGKGWDINNPCEACIDAAWSEQVGTGAQSQPESSGEGPFMSRSASANVSMLCQDLGDSSPPPPPLVALGPRLQPFFPCGMLHPQR